MRRYALALFLLVIAIGFCDAAPGSEPATSGSASGVPLCGNGQRGGSEQCDDGNTLDDDCCSATCMFVPSNAHCNHAVDIDPSSQAAGPFADYMAGWQFTPQSMLTVVGLGVYDREEDGLVDVHQVGLWLATGQLITSAQVPTLTIAPLVGRFRYVPVDPVVLQAGQSYVVAALYHKLVIEWWAEQGDITFDPRVTFEKGREQFQVAGLQLPATMVDTPRFGPSMLLVGTCGDSVVDGGEECDDGNAINLDGCSTTCVIDGPTPTPSATSSATPTETEVATETSTPTLTTTAASPTVTSTSTPTVPATDTPTPTVTTTITTPTVTTPTPTRTTTAVATATSTRVADPTITRPAGTPTRTTTPVMTVSPTPCVGDCSGDGFVRIDELILAVNIALEKNTVDECRAGDANGNGRITVDELVASVNHALHSCGSA